MIFYNAEREDGTIAWEATQADARAINRNFAQVDVPVSKPELLQWLRDNQAELDRLRRAPAAEQTADETLAGDAPDPLPASPPPPPPPPPAEPRPMNAIEMSEAIMDMEGADFERILQATIGQLGLLRMQGYSGLEALRKRDPYFLTNVRARTSVERGLGYLLLEAHPDAG